MDELLDGGCAIDPGHVQVHQDDVGIELLCEAHGIGAVAGLADDCEVLVALEHAAQPVTNDRVVVDDQDSGGTHALAPLGGEAIAGTRAEIAVPPPGSDSIDNVPATRFAR